MVKKSLFSAQSLNFAKLVGQVSGALDSIRKVPDPQLRSKMARTLHGPLTELKEAAFHHLDALDSDASVVQSLDEIAAELRDLM